MEVSFFWSWWSFFAGVGATFVFLIGLMVVVAIGQATKAKKRTSKVDDMLGELAKWSGSGSGKN